MVPKKLTMRRSHLFRRRSLDPDHDADHFLPLLVHIPLPNDLC
jgi:hypothetical protein